MDVTLSRVDRLQGNLAVPGDKSVSHRALIFAAMAAGRSIVRGAAHGADVASTAASLARLGLDVPAGPVPRLLSVEGLGWQVAREADLDAGNSGTTMRLLTGALAGRPGRFVLSGDASLSSRPMERVASPLRRMGASLSLAEGGRPPIRVEGRPLRGIAYDIPIASAQVKGAVLLAGLQAEGPTSVAEPGASRDHTERMLAWLGLPVSIAPGSVTLAAGKHLPLPAFELDVPGDFSSAAFWVVAATLVPGSQVCIEGVGVNPSRTGLLEILASMGAEVEVIPQAAEPELVGSLRARAAGLRGVRVSGGVVARTIDELPLVAVAATQAEGVTTIRDAAELRVKESDRLAVLATGLRGLGADVEEAPDGLSVRGPTPLHGGRVESAGDHRMAMAFAVAAMVAGGPVTIGGWEGTAISYPGFLDDLGGLAS
ncbi:MAG: 3-phosphoshikimate 1-carboxyvinyltransferase [Actinomycetota bacterium]|jgi:3-phosphoshikimate 1-carboxyvinyltransferase|nr:3-phosphoshikimate 1-carboxyvinyltransferase [Actinomycetota bacterium]